MRTETFAFGEHRAQDRYPFSDDEVKQQIQEEVSIKPEFALEAFSDLEKDVRQPIRRI